MPLNRGASIRPIAQSWGSIQSVRNEQAVAPSVTRAVGPYSQGDVASQAKRLQGLLYFVCVLEPNDFRPKNALTVVEHAQIVAPDDFARFASLHVIASMQPSHQTTDMRWAEKRLGAERIKGAYAWRTMLNDGVKLAFGTDWPVEIINPMRGVHACVTRQLPDGTPAGGWQPQEKISMDECIAAYTTGAAYAEFEEGKKGQLVPGQYADFIVLSADVTKIPPGEILHRKVLKTVVGGRVVYSAAK